MNTADYAAYVSDETLMGPNSVRILGELLDKHPVHTTPGDEILDLGCGTGLASLVLARETGAHVLANDLWTSTEDNDKRFADWGSRDR